MSFCIDGYGAVGPEWFRFEVLTDISKERNRQESLKAAGKFPATCADDTLLSAMKCAVLTEELGEVARVLCERECKPGCEAGSNAKLYEELVQVAAVATAWCEALKLQMTKQRAREFKVVCPTPNV
jgi:NTP pyrophosphatase (non-canonical NTP hydrolase)